MVSVAVLIIMLISEWTIYKKMGRQGWEGIVPIYNTYVLCEELYGNGFKFLLFIIPLYNIYFMFKVNIDWAHKFNLGTGFGIGMTLLSPIFYLILAFGSAQYGDGSLANTSEDLVSNITGKATELLEGDSTKKKLADLYDMRSQGLISDEEYELKREELLKKM